MARGDISTVITANMADNATATVQPSSGVEILVTDAGVDVDSINWSGSEPNKMPRMSVTRYDGTDETLLESGEVSQGGATIWFRGTKHFFDNTNYVRYKNLIGATRDASIAYIEVG